MIGRTATVLVVDDTEYNRDVLRRRLERLGHRVIEAEDGQAALERIALGGIDLLLLDLMIPGISGFEVLERVKADAATRDLPVIVISALNDTASVVRSIRTGAEDHLVKPFDATLLRARVEACLERKWLIDREAAQRAELDQERRRSEALLRNVFPSAVVERLQRGETVIADSLENVTVLFADIVGFSAVAARMPPVELVSLLQELFACFDVRVESAGVEKIKTIGDSYMVAGGLDGAGVSAVERVVEVGLGMMADAAALSERTGERLQLRVGVHLGPVVAGVLGTRRTAYDLWGDTVNVASRMESQGTPGKVQVTRAVASVLGERWVTRPLGEVAVRGVGPTEVFLVEAKVPALAAV